MNFPSNQNPNILLVCILTILDEILEYFMEHKHTLLQLAKCHDILDVIQSRKVSINIASGFMTRFFWKMEVANVT